MTIELIKSRIAEIDAMLDTDISDDDFDKLEAEAARLTAELGRQEAALAFRAADELTDVNIWTRDFLTSIRGGTCVITNRQADCFRRINGGQPFVFEGRRFDCPGPNYRAGFAHVVVTTVG